VAWFLGNAFSESNLLLYVKQAVPQAARFEQMAGQTYAAYADQEGTRLLGYVTVGAANGYGGPLTVAVAVSPEGAIFGTTLVSTKETPSYLSRVLDNGGLSKLIGKSYADPFQLRRDVDTISGATYTTRALADSVAQAGREIARTRLGFKIPEPPPPPIQFGLPEIMLVILFALGFAGRMIKGKLLKPIRWASMIAGLVVLGFIFNLPITLSLINRFLLGFWPQWQTGLYWYILAAGILFSAAIGMKNPYCEWFCPFGAAQECLGAIGGAHVQTPERYRDVLKWVQRGVAWLAILIALVLRNPGVSSYEIFGALFGFVGSTLQFILLVMVLLGSLVVRRPWCRFLCPVRPVVDYVQMIGRWMRESWQSIRRETG
jgi:NosR/NirI family transcriptional regulator, nitrous oxide reductase regulator